jgi:hypothetical protein
VLRELHVQLLQGGLGPAGKQNTEAMHEYPYPLSAIAFGLLETLVLSQTQTHYAIIPCSFASKPCVALFAPRNRCGGSPCSANWMRGCTYGAACFGGLPTRLCPVIDAGRARLVWFFCCTKGRFRLLQSRPIQMDWLPNFCA